MTWQPIRVDKFEEIKRRVEEIKKTLWKNKEDIIFLR
jgi:hypothetical protein